MAPTSTSGMANVTRTERCRRNTSRGVNSTTAADTNVVAVTIMRTEHIEARRLRYGRRSTATASATTATSDAMVYGFGSHPSGA